MKIVKKFSLIMMSLVLLIMTPNMVFAAEKTDAININRPYVIINGTHIVYEGENFESLETGEYFRWTRTRGIDKEFTFKIRYSIESPKFTVNGDQALVTADAHVENNYEEHLSGFDGHLYTVSLNGWYSRALQFSVGQEQSGTIRNLQNGGEYSIEITNNDYLEYGHYLVGSGSVES